jgi:hypothetical protein
MPISVTSVERLQQYIRGVMTRADHHAHDVDEVILAIVGGVLWRADGDLQVRGEDGDLKNVLWFEVDGERYAISYRREPPSVEIRQHSTQGPAIHSFDDDSSLADIKDFFASL